MRRKCAWIVVGLTVLIIIAAQANNVNAVMIDVYGWVKLNQIEKENYLKGYWDGLIAGIGQGVRFAKDTRTPDEKVFKEAYELWANVGITTLLPQIDSYYSNRSKRKMMVMHAITQILVEMKLKQLQSK